MLRDCGACLGFLFHVGNVARDCDVDQLDRLTVQDRGDRMQLASCIGVGVLWGCTNSFIKRGSVVADSKASGTTRRFSWSVVDLWFDLLTTWRFLLPQALNLVGSICFALLLGRSPLSLVVPVTNAVSLLSNAVTDWALGEPIELLYAAPGVLILALGVGLCAS